MHYANRLDPGQQSSGLMAGLSSNLFATQAIIPHKKQADFQSYEQHTALKIYISKLPSIKRISMGELVNHCQV